MRTTRSAAKTESESSDSSGRWSRPRSIAGATRRKSAVTTSATIQTTSSSSDLAAERQAFTGGRAPVETIVPSERIHTDMKRNEVQKAMTKPTVSHPWLAEERAQRNTSPGATLDAAGRTARNTSSIGALKSRGSQRLTSAIATPTNGTSANAR